MSRADKRNDDDLKREPRLVTFDFSGTLVRNIDGLVGVYPRIKDDLARIQSVNTDVYLGIITNGDKELVRRYLGSAGVLGCFTHPASGTELIIGGRDTVAMHKPRTVQPKPSFLQRVNGITPEPVTKMETVHKVLPLKPDPTGAHWLMQVCEITDPRNVVHIGDDLREDKQLAQYAGVHFVHTAPYAEGVATFTDMRLGPLFYKAQQLFGQPVAE